MGNRSLKTRSSPTSSRSCDAASSCSSASKARVWMSSRCGISIAESSFPKEICFIVSAIDHPHAGENSPAPAPSRRFRRGRGEAEKTSVVRRREMYTIAPRSGRRPAGRLGRSRRAPPGGTPIGRARGRARPGTATALLDLDGRALLLELGLHRVRLVLRDALLHRRRRAVDEVLRLLEAQAGQLAHDLDDLDLLVAGAHEA